MAAVLTDNLAGAVRVADEGTARAAMRSQIMRLERALGSLAFELGMSGRAAPLPDPGSWPASDGPRMLSLAELEAVRDRVIARVRAAERALGERLDAEAEARSALESMIAAPGEYRFVVIQRAELGEPGCGAYQVRPRLGLLGMLFGWWCVKLSSGCP